MSDTPDTVSTVHKLKQQVDTLTEQQMEALKQATYLGMTSDEAKEYDQRRKRITKMVQELGDLEKAL